MGLFGQSTPFDGDVEKATCESNTNENWALIMDVCDKVSSNPRLAKDCLKSVMKRMGHADPHIVMQAITLLDALASNCGKPIHLEIASRDFENEFQRLLAKAQPKVATKMRQVLKNWAENDFKADSQLNLIPSLYNKLRQEGMDFSNLNEKPMKSAAKMVISKDPNVVNSQQEEDDIAKAIELSLKENKSGSPQQQQQQQQQGSGSTSASAPSITGSYPSLYPSFAGTSMGSSSSANNSGSGTQPNAPAAPPQQEARKVRALYDFEAAEDNELTFKAGEIIHVLDDSDANWWKGYNQRGDGLFPSNFVTADLSIDPERLDINMHNKTTQSMDEAKELEKKKTEAAAAAVAAAAAAAANERVEIDENKIDRLLHLLHEANPEDPSQDTDEMLRLEQEVHQMGPLIDAELERVDRKHAQLTQLSCDLVDAINLYHQLMRDDRSALLGSGGVVGGGYRPTAAPNSQALYAAAGYPGQASAAAPAGVFPLQATGGGNPQIAAAYGYGAAPADLQQQQQQLPSMAMQYQSEHANAVQLKSDYEAAQRRMAQQQQHPQPQIFGMPQPQLPAAPPTNYQMPPQQQQQQQHQPHPQQFSGGPALGNGLGAAPPTADLSGMPGSMGPQPQQQQQQQQPPSFMSPQHDAYIPQQQHQHQQQQQQQPQLSYGGTAMPNGIGMPIPYMPPQQQQQPPAGVVPLYNNNNVNHANGGMMAAMPNATNNNADHYNQLQQQMAAMSMAGGGGVGGGAALPMMMGGGAGGAGVGMGLAMGGVAMMGGGGGGIGLNHHQPVTQSFLVQNEPKNNIPIYQQQR